MHQLRAVEGRSRTRRRVTPMVARLLRLGFLLAAVGLSVWAVASRWEEVSVDLRQIGWLRLLLCAPAMVGGLLCGMLSWRAVLRGLGSPLGTKDGGRIYFVGQLGKYLPGSVWPVLAQMELGRDHQIPRRRSAGALIIAVVVSLATGLIIAGLTVPFVAGEEHPTLWWLMAPVPLLVVVLLPGVLLAVLRRLPVLDLAAALPPALPGRSMGAAVAWSTLGWLSYGVHVTLLAGAFPSGGAGSLVVASLGGYPLAWAAGMIAFMLPAGAGARDVTLVLALSAVVATNSAIAAAVVSRAVTTACDLALAAVAVLGARTAVRRRSAGPDTPVAVGAEEAP